MGAAIRHCPAAVHTSVNSSTEINSFFFWAKQA